ncbi:MAG: aminotransferase class V-fold PLP-dependent enzyme [Alphaproteobacteria bacterium]|jgi:cysteine desulfurase / selenocysteine lyase|nr:aminotransferase class V-fold PLP-dependent enzyme [Alphaproteobacteria bacterium]MBT4085996.1 aminotransferase class V-fold PLP-dependent enzyme [Alphaproteobacteria bacterium]MBT4546546.1 aminotransferase class V-fold PLP-dependent enzyme [Alphaproteobacteria bacterium]MBT7745975.1 aminotransferase class V-fold PLP-dependent enzyme [Alphaproteobacteria bacterium]
MKSYEFGDGPQKLYEGTRLPEFDIVRARRETPGTEHVLHFNNAGAALMPEVVSEAVSRHLQLESDIGGYEAAARAARPLARVYDAVAELINGHTSEIAIVENATRAWDMAFYGMTFAAGDRILTCRTEYASNYIAYLQVARKTGAVIEAIPSDESGQIDVAALADMIDDRVKLIAITHVPTNGGLVNPAAAVGQIAKSARIPYLLDACQSVGQMPIDVEEIGCDMLSATGRKYLRGPRGTGFLWVRDTMLERLEPPFLDLHAASWTSATDYELQPDAKRFENWEGYVAGRAGLCAAVEYASRWGLEASYARIQTLAASLRNKLESLPGVTVHDIGAEKCGIVTFQKSGHDVEDMVEHLHDQSINVSSSSTFSTRLDMEDRNLDVLLRASVHYYNTDAEIERFCEVIEGL